MYINGVLSHSSATYEGDLAGNSSEPLIIGSSLFQNHLREFRGLVDDIRIYTSDRSLTIADDMNQYPEVDDSNLNAYFDFNLERHGDTVTSVPNMATGAGASSASLTTVNGTPEFVRTWDVSTVGSDTVLSFERTVLTAQGRMAYQQV